MRFATSASAFRKSPTLFKLRNQRDGRQPTWMIDMTRLNKKLDIDAANGLPAS